MTNRTILGFLLFLATVAIGVGSIYATAWTGLKCVDEGGFCDSDGFKAYILAELLLPLLVTLALGVTSLVERAPAYLGAAVLSGLALALVLVTIPGSVEFGCPGDARTAGSDCHKKVKP